jgi:(p)ppGpp synthase/HD superfamily hydrolase
MSETTSKDVELAWNIAKIAHNGQFRRDGKTPFIVHPVSVAAAVESLDEKVVAFLHDTIEDSKIGFDDLLRLGIKKRHALAVFDLTKRKDEPLEIYLRRIHLNKLALAVKIADMQHNLNDVPTERQKEKYARSFQILMQLSEREKDAH